MSCSNEAALSEWGSRAAITFLFVTITSLSPVYSLGEFQFVLRSFDNDRRLLTDGSSCCDGGGGGASTAAAAASGGSGAAGGSGGGVLPSSGCRSACRTFFRLCLGHYQANIPPDPQCTYGSATTDVLASSAFNSSVYNDTGHRASFEFNFTWTGSFTLVIEAFHDTTGGSPYEGSPRKLITRVAIQRLLTVGVNWTSESFVDPLTRASMAFAYRVVCLDSYYGPGCSRVCFGRDDLFGHYDCDVNGRKVCRYGWTGTYCEQPVCLEGCSATSGSCTKPFECRCKYGWEGTLCDKCIKHPDCNQGNCSLPWECDCYQGWGGPQCNIDLDYCSRVSPCLNGATCMNSRTTNYTCQCSPDYEGRDCGMVVSTRCTVATCLNGGTCQMSNGNYACLCPYGYSGSRCERNGDAKSSRNYAVTAIIEHKETSSDISSVPNNNNNNNNNSSSSNRDNASVTTAARQSRQLTRIILIVCLGTVFPAVALAVIIVVCVVLRRRRVSSRRRSDAGAVVGEFKFCAKTSNAASARSDQRRPETEPGREKLNNNNNYNNNIYANGRASDKYDSSAAAADGRTRLGRNFDACAAPHPNNDDCVFKVVVEAPHKSAREGGYERKSNLHRPPPPPPPAQTRFDPYSNSADGYPEILTVRDFILKHSLPPKHHFPDTSRSQGERRRPTTTSVEYDFVSVVARWRYDCSIDALSTEV